MPYPARPVPDPLPQFVGTATVRQTEEQREALLSFVEKGYREGRSLRELAALTDRTQTAIRRALSERGVALRPRGAPALEG
ncbi:helix-turn-helix domain-containing protein [Intrasporangium sp.]|uniref:helix-turn-helix domain-containing protein n=1 Tax=Intrasporangium sp. TaxID=1925024 RepID=UPI003464C78A